MQAKAVLKPHHVIYAAPEEARHYKAHPKAQWHNAGQNEQHPRLPILRS